jgi:hypothetical protein
MTTINPRRRALTFDSLDRVMPDVDRLLQGHSMIGHWSLGQICSHLTRGIVGSVDGFPRKAPWIVRATIGPMILRRILSGGRMKEGIKLPPEALPKPESDARAEAEALRAAIAGFSAHTGPFAPHPVFGPMSRDQWDRLHRIHCAHHLSFALPDGPA